MRFLLFIRLIIFWLVLLSVPTLAQQSETFGPFELHYSVVNTTFLAPEIATIYNITRGEKRAILNLAVREKVSDGSDPRAMELKGRTWDFIQTQPLEFREIREAEAIYYIAEFTFINEEWRFFEVDFRPTGAQETYTFKLKHQLYTD